MLGAISGGPWSLLSWPFIGLAVRRLNLYKAVVLLKGNRRSRELACEWLYFQPIQLIPLQLLVRAYIQIEWL